MELKDTVALMESTDFKDRFKGEYYQTKIRYEKLHAMIVKYEAGTLNFEPKCSIELLKEQSAAIGKYLYMLEVRATIEGVELLERVIVMTTRKYRKKPVGNISE